MSSTVTEKPSDDTAGQKAFDKKAFREIAEYVTTTDGEVIKGMVNLNTAPREVLACLPGLTDSVADEIVGSRADREEGFRTVADLLDVEGMSLEEFKQVCPHVSVRSDVFRARSFGVVAAR